MVLKRASNYRNQHWGKMQPLETSDFVKLSTSSQHVTWMLIDDADDESIIVRIKLYINFPSQVNNKVLASFSQ